MNDSEHMQKTVGRRSSRGRGLEANAGFFALVLGLRGGRPFVPRGVFRFRSFEESDAWMTKMMARPSNPDRRP